MPSLLKHFLPFDLKVLPCDSFDWTKDCWARETKPVLKTVVQKSRDKLGREKREKEEKKQLGREKKDRKK